MTLVLSSLLWLSKLCERKTLNIVAITPTSGVHLVLYMRNNPAIFFHADQTFLYNIKGADTDVNFLHNGQFSFH